MKWKKIGEGSFNTSYRSDNGRGNLVLKIAFDKTAVTDSPQRSVRLWNLINKHIHPPAELYREKIKGKWRTVGWICPYIEGRQANDLEIKEELLNIFNRKGGRIITDAAAHRNFLRTRNGQTVCIDIGMALQGELRETAGLIGMRRERRPSLTSQEVWDEYASRPGRGPWLDEQQSDFPKSTKTTKALLFIKEQRTDITNVDFLRKSPKKIKLLAEAYDRGRGPVFDQAVALLAEKCPPDLEESKQRCRDIFLEFIYTKGTIDENDQFIPNSIRSMQVLPFINRAMTLMREVNLATSCDECHNIVGRYLAESKLESDEGTDTSSLSVHSSLSSGSNSHDPELESTLRYFQELTNDEVILADIQKQCRDILGAYIVSFGLPDRMETGLNTAEYKSQLFLQQVDEKLKGLIGELDQARSFEEMSACLDAFSQKIPPSLKRDVSVAGERISPIDGLVASVNFCRKIVSSAQRTMLETPSAETDARFEI